MANADLKTFLEDRLRALDPSIDLDAGSPAQIQFIEPVLTRLGTDPFETSIDTFLTDRFAQEFPDIYAQDPSVVRDVFVKPLIVMLEPFKREIETIKRNQSLVDPSVLSDEDAEAIAANIFEERDSGGFSVGTARVFFPNPTNVQAEITTRFFTADGLNFYPTNPVSITAEEMVFNRSGALYYFDIPVKAEKEGSEYNIDEDSLSGVDGIYGAVRITNPRDFANGASKLDTESFVATAREALTERSLVTRRGATARIRQVFQTDVRAIQVIGARDPEMQRDLLVAASPGHSWIVGLVTMYGKIAYVRSRVIEGEESEAPTAGDDLFVYLNKYDFPGIQQGSRTVRFKVEELLGGPYGLTTDPYQTAYIVRVSGDWPTGLAVTFPAEFDGGFSKKGTIRISSLPDIGEVSLSVPNGEVHVYGHSDVYVRPILQDVDKAILTGLYDKKSFVERTTGATRGGETTEKNRIEDSGFNFANSGAQPGDVLVIETTEDAGSYVIQKVTANYVYLAANLTKTRTNVRYRILKKITIDPFEPKVSRFPFGSLVANDLSTVIGSTLFNLATHDIIAFGAREGDILRVTGGNNPQDYVIKGFDSVLGGKGPIVDRAAVASEGSLSYEVFTLLETVEKPLVRIKEVMLLDSAQQTTGITIPPAEPVACVPTCDFSSARVRASSQRRSGFVLPNLAASALTTYVSAGNTAAPGTGGSVITSDRRYSLGFDTALGTYKPFYTTGDAGSTRDYFEFDFRADAFEGCSYFLAVHEFDDETENFPPIDPKPGECLTLKSGPNKGSYLIKNVVKQKYKLYNPSRTAWVYFIQIYGTFPVDIMREVIEMLNNVANETGGPGIEVTELPISGAVEFPKFFSDLYDSFGLKLQNAFTASGLGAPPPAATLQAVWENITQVDYEWGDPARGIIRSYFLEPVLFTQNTGESGNATVYEFTTETGDVMRFRADPERYTKQELIPARLTVDAELVDYPRDLDASTSGQATFTDTTKPSVFEAGIQAGDILEVHEEVFFHDPTAGNARLNRTAVKTVANGTQITAPDASGNIFTSQMVGNLVFFDQGEDAGGYRVVKFIDGKNLVLDRPLTISTPTILEEGDLDSWGHDGVDNKVVSGTSVTFESYVGKFLTIYGMDYRYQGSYEILGTSSGTTAILNKPNGDFSGSPIMNSELGAYWVITDAPPNVLDLVDNGVVMYGLQAIRMYQMVPEEMVIASVKYDDPTISQLTIPSGLRDGISQPYRIYRKNIRRVSPTEMSDNREGPFVFFDTEVVSLNPQPAANLENESYLTLEEGTYESAGYRHIPDDPNLTYSTKETGTIELPTRLLPTDSEDSADNYLNLLGAPVQITYEKADVVRLLQDFLDSPQDRVTAANMLARHFLPAYVSYDAEYVGGSAASTAAKDIIDYIDTVPVEEPLDVSELEEAIIRRGGNPVTPTKAMVVIHDWDRRAWLEFSENQVGGTETKVPYNGTPRVSYFTPGPDVSGQDDVPAGERINLTKR
jgi:hypothetical protein